MGYGQKNRIFLVPHNGLGDTNTVSFRYHTMALITHKQYLSGITLWPSSHTNSICPASHYGPHHTQTVSFWYHTMALIIHKQYLSGTTLWPSSYTNSIFLLPHYGPEHKTTLFFWYRQIGLEVQIHGVSGTTLRSSTQNHGIFLWTRTQNHSILLVPPYILNTKTQYTSGTTLYPQHKNTVSFWYHPMSSTTTKNGTFLILHYGPEHKNRVSFWYHLCPQHKATVSFWYYGPGHFTGTLFCTVGWNDSLLGRISRFSKGRTLFTRPPQIR